MKSALVWLWGGSSLVYVLSRFLPCAPPVSHGEIEDSYMQALHTAFAGSWQFGRDFIFTFGPWGFLYSGYHPGTHTLAVLIWLGLAVAFWGAAWLAARRLWSNVFAGWLWVMSVAAVAGLPIFMMIDVGLKGFVALLWLHAFFLESRAGVSPAPARISEIARGGRRDACPTLVLAMCLGLLSLVKFSVMMDSVAVVALISLDAVIRRRCFPWVLVVFGASVLLFWVAARQDLGCLGPFLRYSWLLTSGFAEGMAFTGPSEALDISLFLSVAALLCGVAGWLVWTSHGQGRGRAVPAPVLALWRRRFYALLPLAGLGWLVFTAFKYGYVRHDGHEVAATLELLLLGLMLPAVAAAAPPGAPAGCRLTGSAGAKPATGRLSARSAFRAAWGIPGLSLLPPLLALGLAGWTFSRYYPGGLLAHVLATFEPRQVAAPVTLLRGESGARAAYETYQAAIRAGQSLGPLAGTVDTYPGNAAALLARGLTYRPRPVMQSYQANTPEVAELNAAFLRGPRAPDSIFFQVIPIDDHFPMLDDGLSWPDILTRYDIREVSWSGVVLQRSPSPRPWRLVPLANMAVGFGETVALPAVTNAAVWAKLDLPLTLAGRAACTFFKPPILWLTIWTEDGQQLRYRVVPGLARGGFLLSPLVADSVSFGLLASTGGLRDLSRSRLTAARLSADTGSGLTSCYQSPARLELFRLEFAGQDLAAVAGFREMTRLWEAVRRLVWLSADYPPQLVSLPGVGSVLRVAPRSAMQLPLEDHPARLRLSFGVLGTNAVIFRVSALGEGGKWVELWSRQIAGLEEQHAVVELGAAKSSDIILETAPADPAQKGGAACYWREIGEEASDGHR